MWSSWSFCVKVGAISLNIISSIFYSNIIPDSKMNFSEAVKGVSTKSEKLCAIHSSWETEFGLAMTDSDIANLLSKFTLDETYANLQKVVLNYRLI